RLSFLFVFRRQKSPANEPFHQYIPQTASKNLTPNPSAMRQSKRTFSHSRRKSLPPKRTKSANAGTAGNMKCRRKASAKSARSAAAQARVSPQPGHGMPVRRKNGHSQPKK